MRLLSCENSARYFTSFLRVLLLQREFPSSLVWSWYDAFLMKWGSENINAPIPIMIIPTPIQRGLLALGLPPKYVTGMRQIKEAMSYPPETRPDFTDLKLNLRSIVGIIKCKIPFTVAPTIKTSN